MFDLTFVEPADTVEDLGPMAPGYDDEQLQELTHAQLHDAAAMADARWDAWQATAEELAENAALCTQLHTEMALRLRGGL